MKPVLLPSDYLAQCYSENYSEAQHKFKSKCSSALAQSPYQEFAYPQTGPNGEALLTAVTWQGNPHADKILVIQSATHGIEGFTGSAIQLDTLHNITTDTLPNDVAVLYIHALNPYGFAWLRRVNEQGVDLNRNFVDFTQALPDNPGYAQLASSLLPEKISDMKNASQTLDAYRQAFGQQALESAVSGGQYQFAEGLFYGGSEPSQSRLHLQQIIAEFNLAQRSSVAVIDIHSGLGAFGYGEVICDHLPGSAGVARARQWYGESVTEPALGSSTSVPKQGLIDYMWHQLGEQVCFITLEFGTYSIEQMFDVLRQDHILHRSPVDWSAAATQQVKQNIRKVFYPASPDWQEMVLLRGRQCVRQALQGLSDPL